MRLVQYIKKGNFNEWEKLKVGSFYRIDEHERVINHMGLPVCYVHSRLGEGHFIPVLFFTTKGV